VSVGFDQKYGTKNDTGPLKFPEQRPTLIARRHIFAGGRLLRVDQRQRQVAVAEQLAVGALLQVQAVRRPQHPRRQLRDRVLAVGLVPVAAFARTGTVRPLHEFQRDTAHDELRRLGGEPRIAPPTETAFDVRIRLLRLRSIVLCKHPRSEQAALEVLTGVVLQQRPRGDVHREAAVVLLVYLLVRHEQVAGHFRFLRRRGIGRGRGYRDERE
jgi:hypothetical protein